MKKFIVIDHSLCNLQGHHYECSLSVAEAAAREGYEPIIITNKIFPQSLKPDNIKVISSLFITVLGIFLLIQTFYGLR